MFEIINIGDSFISVNFIEKKINLFEISKQLEKSKIKVITTSKKRSLMNKPKDSIFREELPGEKKSIINLLMTGHIVTISCLGYMAFFLFIQLGQVTRIVDTIDPNHMTVEQVNLLKERISRSVGQWQNEMIGLAIIGSIVSIIGGIYTINMVYAHQIINNLTDLQHLSIDNVS